MANKYTYSRMITTDEGAETFTAVECASFDEAKKEVWKGIRDRSIELEAERAAKLAAKEAADRRVPTVDLPVQIIPSGNKTAGSAGIMP
jgi:hypothetical protein